MTRAEKLKRVPQLKKELLEELKNNGLTKEAVFLQSTINLYLTENGKPEGNILKY